jgi:hypothetical protein
MADHYLYSPLPDTSEEMHAIIDRHATFVRDKGAKWCRHTMIHLGNPHDALPWGFYTQAWDVRPDTDDFEFPYWRTMVNKDEN